MVGLGFPDGHQDLNGSEKVVDLFGNPVAQESRVSESRVGQAAEFFACGVLSGLGYQVYHVPSVGYDALLDVGGRILRLQIKGRAKGPAYKYICQYEESKGDWRGKERVRRPIDRRDADLLALVALDLRRVWFRAVPVDGIISAHVSRRMLLSPDAEYQSLQTALAEIVRG